ncbi:MAG: sugar nucleotide-binding protein, partial [Thermoguttaceae bacterium]
MLRLGASQREVRVVADQHCTPSYVPHVARAILFLAGINSAKAAPWGIYHVTNSGATTWYDFAVARYHGVIHRAAELRPS